MDCSILCIIAFGFIFASIYSIMACKQHPVFLKFRAQLDEKQLKIYDEITKQRSGLFIQGGILGLFLAIIFFALLYKKDENGGNINKSVSICGFPLIILATQYFYYSLMPKKMWMLDNVKNQEETKMWLDIYKEMKKRYHIGFLLGGLGYAILASALIKLKKK